MQSLHQDEIRKLEDKKLQLAYMLGGIRTGDNNSNCGRYWICDIRCSCTSVEDDERLDKVIDFITRHNISNETFLRLVLTYLRGSFNSYKGDFGSLILELDRAILDYEFRHTTYAKFKENDLKERELLQLIERESEVEGTQLNSFFTTYSLTPVDFMILAKTSLNYAYSVARGFKVKDLPADLNTLLKDQDLYQSYEFVQAYRQSFEKKLAERELAKGEQGNMPLVKRLYNRFKKNN